MHCASTLHRPTLRGVAAALLFTLAACGGGGGGEPAPDPLARAPAWGPAGSTLPPGAKVVTPEQMRALITDDFEIQWLQPAPMAAAVAAEQARAADANALLAASTDPTLAARRDAGLETGSATVLADGTREVTVDSADGELRVVVDGPAQRAQGLADSARALGSRANALKLYTRFREALPDWQLADQPAPEALATLSDAEVQAQVDVLAQRMVDSLPNVSAPSGAVGSAAAAGRRHTLGLQRRLAANLSSGCEHSGSLSAFTDFDFALKPYLTGTRWQGHRGTCASFALSGAFEAKILQTYNRKVDLSEQQLYAQAKGVWFPTANAWGDGLPGEALLNQLTASLYPLRTERLWAYNPSTERVVLPAGYQHSCDGYGGFCSDTNHQLDHFCTFLAEQVYCMWRSPAAAGMTRAERYVLTGHADLWRGSLPLTLAAIQASLAYGDPVLIGVDMDTCLRRSSFKYKDADGNLQTDARRPWLSLSRCAGQARDGRHAMLVVGALTNAQLAQRYGSAAPPSEGGYFIVKNSWGCGAGDGGYVYMSASYLASVLNNASSITDVNGDGPRFTNFQAGNDMPLVVKVSAGGNIVQPATITLTATTNNLVKRVVFRRSAADTPGIGALIADVTGSSPFTTAFPVGAADNGDLYLSAVGYDGDGNTVDSRVIQQRVRIPGAPSVTLAASATDVDAGSTVTLSASAASNDGSAVARVEFFQDGAKLGEDTVAPYTRAVTLGSSDVGDVRFTARAVNGNGFATLSAPVTVTVRSTTKPLIASFSATPALLTATGTTKLQWATSGAQTLVLNPGAVDVTGTTSRDVAVGATTTYTLVATNGAGSTQASTTVTLAPPPAIASFTATPSTTAVGGGTVTLAWSASNAGTLSIGPGVGDVTGLVSKTVAVNASTTFTLTATNASGSTTRQVTVTVPATPTAPPAITAFAATPASLPYPGGASTLSWIVSGATSLAIDGGVGDVSGSTSKSVNVASTTTFTLTASNGAGSSSAQVTVSVAAPPPAPPVITAFTASPASLPAGGGSSTLAWSTSGADSLVIAPGVGSVSGLANTVVALTATTTYTLTATNAGGSTTAQVTVSTAAPPSEFFVDAVAGNDGNAGSAAAPFKTLRKAFGVAGSGSTVWLRDGGYHYFYEGLAANERLAVPAGVTLRGVTVGGALLQFGLLASASATIADLAWDLGDSLGSAVLATGGNVVLRRLRFTNAGRCDAGAVRAAGTANVTLDPGDTPAHEYAGAGVRGFARVVDAAVLTVNGGRISGAGRDLCAGGAVLSTGQTAQLVLNGVSITGSDFLVSSGEYKAVVAAFGSSRVTLANTLIDGANSGDDSANAGVRTVEGGAATVQQGSIIRNLPGISGLGVWAQGTGPVLIADSTLSGNGWGLTGGGQAITLRSARITDNRFGGVEMQYGGSLTVTGSTISGNWPAFVSTMTNPRASAIGLLGGGDFAFTMRGSTVTGNGNGGASSPAIVLIGSAASSFDLGGSGADANTLRGNANTGLEVSTFPGIAVRASGTTWNAGVQDADAQGRYRVPSPLCGSSPCTVTGGNGANFRHVTGGPLMLAD